MKTLDMKKLDRKHYLKHYQGSFGMALRDGRTLTGQIESVDIEDGTVSLRSGEASHFIDGDEITVSLKKFKDLSDTDIQIIVDNIVIDSVRQKADDIDIIDRETIGCVNILMKDKVIFITDQWYIHTKRVDYIDNIGTIILLLCELGYNVTDNLK